MRQRLEVRVVFERQMRAFIRFNQREDLRSFGYRHRRQVRLADRRNWFAIGHESQPMRGNQPRGMALQSSERCEVISFSGHGIIVWTLRTRRAGVPASS